MIRGATYVQVGRDKPVCDRNHYRMKTPHLLFALLVACFSPLTAQEAKDEALIQEVLAGFVAAWNKHDAAAFAMVFAPDADFTNVRGTSARGRAEIEKHHAPLFAGRFKETNQKMTETKIRFIRPDVAAVDAWWEMTGAKGPDGQEIPIRKGLLSFVMTKDAGKWLITVMHNMDLPAADKTSRP